MGPFMARLSVSSLVFDYILTGPISVVSAGQYLGRLLNEIAKMMQPIVPIQRRITFAAFFGVAVTVYFWWSEHQGHSRIERQGAAHHADHHRDGGGVLDLVPADHSAARPQRQLPPAPCRAICISARRMRLGWFKGTFWPSIRCVALIIAFGHSLLSMSGFETLAQVYREIAYPKLKNLRSPATSSACYAVICTGVITVFAGMIISPSDVRKLYVDNLLGGLAMHLAGPELLQLLFHIFVVIVGVLILSGAVNTSIIGANGVMNRVAEDGVLLDWFRKPHKRFGTTYRIINLIALLQVTTIVAQPRRRLPAGRSLRVRRGVELLPEIAGRAGAALPAARPGIQIPVQHPDRRRGDSGRTGRDHADSGLRGHRQSVFESRSPPSTAWHSPWSCSWSSRSPSTSMRASAAATLAEEAAGGIQPRSSGAGQYRRFCTRARAAYWWPSAITTTWSTCRRCWKRPTCAGTTSW